MKNKSQVWKILEKIQNRGHSHWFEDWLDMILNSLLSMTENMGQVYITKDLSELNKGQYNEKYMEIVDKYQEHEKNIPVGARTIDLMAQAWGQLYKETLETKKDILGDIYEKHISKGENCQYFTPEHISELMAKIVGTNGTQVARKQSIGNSNRKQTDYRFKPETIIDPCCGSGRFLIGSAKENPNNYFIGQDIDIRCCKIAVINLWIFDLNGEIRHGDSLTNKIHKIWKIKRGGFIYEIDDIIDNKMQDGAEVARRPHEPEDEGSNPSPAIKDKQTKLI